MAKELTSGFDVAAHVTVGAVERVFQAYYWMGEFPPDYVARDFEKNGKQETLEIFFDTPTLAFVTASGVSNAIRVTFPYLVRVTTYDNEFTGSATVTLAAEQQDIIDGDQESTVIVVNFQAAGADAFTFTLGPSLAEFEDLVKPALLDSLVSTSEPIILTPPAAPNAGFFVARTYPDSGDGSFLGVFVNFEDVERQPPADLALYDLIFSGSADLRTAIPAEHIMASINAKREEMGLAASQLPGTIEVDGDEYEVAALDIQLRDGHLYVSGEIDDVEFEAWLGLKATNDGLKAVALSTDFDMPWWMDVGNFFSAGAIQRAIEESLPDALESVSTDLAGGLSVFSGSIPGAGFLIKIENAGMATIRETGIILPANLETVLDAPVLKKPTYLKANTETKEFHRPGCVYGTKLKWQRATRFIREAAAIHAGYNGCNFCASEHSHPLARVGFGFFSETAPPGDGPEFGISLEGALLEPVVIDGIEVVNPGFSDAVSLKRATNGTDPWIRHSSRSSYLFVPGHWRFRAHAGSWTGECSLKLRKTAKNFGSTNYIAFTLGKPQGKGGYDEMPAFP